MDFAPRRFAFAGRRGLRVRPVRQFFFAALFSLASLAHAADGGDAGIRFLEDRVLRDPDDFIAWNQLAERYHAQLRRTGDDGFIARELHAAEMSLKAMPAAQNPGGITALAQARLTAHRFVEAHAAAAELRKILPGKTRPLELLVDALTELGDYDEARKVCEELSKLEDSEISATPRLAKLAIIHGQLDRAREHFEKGLARSAVLAPPQPELVAWFHLQLGELAFKGGDWEAAERHYSAAAEVWPEGYSVADHIAELRGAQGRTEEAIALFEKLAAKIPRPEFFQALGDLHVLAARPAKAAAWHACAEAAYLQSVKDGAVHFYHHLAGFYADSKEDAAQAVEWARKDLALRQSIYTHDALAWALYKKGDAVSAAAECAKALATGARDPHLLYHAAMIRMASGDVAGGKMALQQATAVNPKFNTFHVHR